MALMPAPPTPTKWMCLMACLMRGPASRFRRPRARRHGAGPGARARPAIASSAARSRPRSASASFCGVSSPCGRCTAAPCCAIHAALSRWCDGGADDQRHQDRRHAGGAEFAHGDGAGAADHQVARGQALRHVVDEGQHLGIDAGARIGGAHGVGLGRAGLVRDLRALAGCQQGQCLRQRFVQHLRAQAAAHHQQAQRPRCGRRSARPARAGPRSRRAPGCR